MTTPSNAELRKALAVNMGLYYRKSDDKWLREKHDNGRYLGVEDMTPELNSVVKIFQAREQQLLTELLGELPKRVDVKPHDTGIDYYYAKGHDKALDQVVSAIERLQNKTNDGGRDGD